MLEITLQKLEWFDERTQEFITYPEVVVNLEHSLVSLSKWESKWEVPYLTDKVKTDEQIIDYVRCMVVGDIPPALDTRLTMADGQAITSYIEAKMTATWFNEPTVRGRKSTETITAELIYYWMVAHTIPFECQHWHLNKLLTLVRVCSAKNQPEKKRPKQDVIAQQRSLNEQRKAQMNTKG